MPTKAELYAQMAEKVTTQLTGSWQEWAGFLTTASRLYKYPFHEQLMIYAQRPDATACAEYDLWNEKMGRYVRRGSKGIALVDDSGDRPRLRYVFDISDTGTREHSRTPWLWQLEERHLDSVQAMLERTYDVSGDDLAGQLTEVAGKLAEEYWTEHQQDFFYIVDGSFLEEYDEFNIGVQFKAAATVSITYALMSRCGLEPERYFDHEDFMAIFDFNTPATIGALGTAVSQINQQVLRQIGVTVRNAEREANQERSKQDEQSHDLYPERRLSDSRPEAEPAAGETLAKCRYMDEITGNRGVIFATGTPVSNSMTELYTMQRYLQYERLQELNMTHFDCWASRFGETVTALELAPEGTGYRARTRFSKFFNLPELMNLFKEVADIKTADQLNLPTPEVEYHNIVAQPTEHQQEMVKALSERASLVHSGTVDPSQDNMLKITSDGRKLGLDQRIVNQMLPDEPGTKVNQCVDNIMQIWRDGKADKLTQLVFCDISTPQAKAPVSKAAKTLDNPLLHALEGAVPLPEQEPVFTVYDDIRQKLIAQGMPADQIAFIHEANTEVRKKELFSKVRTGQVRVLLGSTAKMGAGTNVQDRLVALHDLDCPWRPGDLAQRKGRIERQGNQNPLVHVYRYVTEGTFDAYLWQTVENKQKFISQIMTSKSPVRSCDDVDETALSFAEIKALCAGDPRIKERMDLDVEVSRLKLMKADHQSKQYRLEDQLLKYFPEEIEKHKGFIKGFESDLEVLAAHPHPEDGFAGMEIRGDLLTDKENAGAALLDACKEVRTSDPVQIGSYRGFTMLVEFEAWKQEYTLLLKGQMTHRATLGTDPRGNLTRIDNALAQMPQRLEAAKAQLDNLYQQQAAAKEEVGKPFLYEEELRSKNARLVELDTLLNIDGKGQAHTESVVAKSTRPSVLDNLKRPVQPRSTDKKPKQHEEVR